ncbi:hypothetical protein AYI68_g1066 [Smittium mucronatum]|uniref:Uncharacterized protein n=1 Tax=Smittium mucronatum TaxID=133383 RepID=A0A1R0H6P6_9FUNG|nr:hypothetical protein AYI68_g1066 [Smittium mucronatum]
MTKFNTICSANIFEIGKKANEAQDTKIPFWMVSRKPYNLTKTIENNYEVFHMVDSSEHSKSFISVSHGNLGQNYSIVDLCVEAEALVCIRDNSNLVLKSFLTSRDIFHFEGRGIITSVDVLGELIAVGRMNGSISVINWRSGDQVVINDATSEKISSIKFLSRNRVLAILQDWEYVLLSYQNELLAVVPHSSGKLEIPPIGPNLEALGLSVDVEDEIAQKKESTAYPTPPSHPQQLEIWPSEKPDSYFIIAWCDDRIQYSRLSLVSEPVAGSPASCIESRVISLTNHIVCKCAHPDTLLFSTKSFLNSESFLQDFSIEASSTEQHQNLLNDILELSPGSPQASASLMLARIDGNMLTILLSSGDIYTISLN